MAKAPIIETHVRSRVHKAERRTFAWQITKGVLKIFALGVFIALIWYVTRLPFFTISEIEVDGGETVSHDEVRTLAETALTGAYFLVIPKRFAYLYPHDAIFESVNTHERVYDVSIERLSRTSIRIHFLEYIPHALWCGDGEATKCYFMTEDGYVFAEAPELMGGAFVRHIEEGKTDIHEGIALSREALLSLDSFIAGLGTELGLRISTVVHKENGDATLFVNGGGMLYVTLGERLESTLPNLQAILASEEFSHIKPGNFQYIDMRFEHKAFVNEEPIGTVASTTDATTTLPES